jgi:hypothetical protein
MTNQLLDDFWVKHKQAVAGFREIIIEGLSDQDDQEYYDICLIIKNDLIPALEDDEGDQSRKSSIQTISDLINDRRAPKNEFEIKNLENAVFYYLLRRYSVESTNSTSEGYLKSKGLTIESLKAKYSGNKFGELVLEHCRKSNIVAINKAISGLSISLPDGIKINTYRFIEVIKNKYSKAPEFWQEDCGKTFGLFIEKIKFDASSINIEGSNDACFDVFNLIVLSLARDALLESNYKKFINKSLGKSFLSGIFG